MSRLRKRSRSIESRSNRPQKVVVQVMNKKTILELWMAILGSLGSIILATVAIYAAFFSPLSDALQAQYKFKDITNQGEIDTLNQSLSEKASELKMNSEELRVAQNQLSIEQRSLRKIEGKIVSSTNKLQSIEKKLQEYEVKISAINLENDQLSTLIAKKQNQYSSLDKLYTANLIFYLSSI